MKSSDWTADILPYLIFPIALYALGLIILFFVIKRSIKSGIDASTVEQKRQNAIMNKLLAEQLKIQGVAKERVEEILAGR